MRERALGWASRIMEQLHRFLSEIRIIIDELTSISGIIFIALLVLVNVIFIYLLPESYLAFLLAQIILIIFWLMYRLVKRVVSRAESQRLLPINDLYRYYENEASRPSPYQEAYKKLLSETRPPGYRWIPGVIELLFETDDIYLHPVVDRGRAWSQLLEELIKPYNSVFEGMFRAAGWNEFKIRPLSVEPENGRTDTLIMHVEPTTYYYDFIIHFSCDFPLHDRGTTLRQALEPLILARDGPRPLRTLKETQDFPLPNSIGINIILISEDGYILLMERSSYVAVEQYAIAPTITGGLDWKTLIHLLPNHCSKVNLLDLVYQEISEKDEISDPTSHYKVYPIALVRNLKFLGKPELTLIGVTKASIQDIINETEKGKKYETMKIIGIKVGDSTYSIKSQSKCELLKTISERVARPLLTEDGEGEVEGRIISPEEKTVKITYNRLSAILIIQLYSTIKAYEELCQQHGTNP